jgi:hypothetical protein
MHAVRSLVAVAILASVTTAVVLFWRLFWSQIDPWLRRVLGRRLGMEIEWRNDARDRAWHARGAERRSLTVDALAIVTRFAGILTPVLVVLSAAIALGLDAYFGRVLVLSTLFASAICGRNAPVT